MGIVLGIFSLQRLGSFSTFCFFAEKFTFNVNSNLSLQ